MEWSDIFKISLGALIPIVGWIVGNHLAVSREIKAAKRKLRIEHMIEMFEVLATEVSHRKMSDESKIRFENAISKIQLLGSNEQVRLAKSLATELSKNGSFELDPLLNSIRIELRNSLRLEPWDGNFTWLRMTGEIQPSTVGECDRD